MTLAARLTRDVSIQPGREDAQSIPAMMWQEVGGTCQGVCVEGGDLLHQHGTKKLRMMHGREGGRGKEQRVAEEVTALVDASGQ